MKEGGTKHKPPTMKDGVPYTETIPRTDRAFEHSSKAKDFKPNAVHKETVSGPHGKYKIC